MTRPGLHRVAAAFAQERDAQYAVRLMRASIDAVIDFSLRPVVGEGGYVQLVVLEATFGERCLEERVVTVIRGAHGVPVPIDVLGAAKAV